MQIDMSIICLLDGLRTLSVPKGHVGILGTDTMFYVTQKASIVSD